MHLPACLTLGFAGRCGFGVSRHVKHNVLHIDDRHILQPLGKHLASYDCSTSEVKVVASRLLQQTYKILYFILATNEKRLLQTGFMLAGDGVPKIWNMALSPNKAYAAVVQSVPADPQKLQVRARTTGLHERLNWLCSRFCIAASYFRISWFVLTFLHHQIVRLTMHLVQCAVYTLSKPKRAKILHVDSKYSQIANIQALAFR